MPKYRKKPVVIDAEYFDGTEASARRIMAVFGQDKLPIDDRMMFVSVRANMTIVDFDIKTLEGVMTVPQPGYVIRGVKGEFYPCRPDIFAATYENAEEAKG
jgi:hypothetical protein